MNPNNFLFRLLR